jgi:hypothetical protein
MRRQALLVNPPVHRIASHPEVTNDLLYRNPPFAGLGRLIPSLIVHESAILSESRNKWEGVFLRSAGKNLCGAR